MQRHLNTECPSNIVSCKFANVGCKTKMKRENMAAHEKDSNLHLDMALNAVIKLQDKLEDATQTLQFGKLPVFTLPEFQKKKESDEEFVFPSFYTGPGGYHMALEVDANGDGDGKGSHVSVFACVLEGKYDTGLKWPLTGHLTCMLLNQLEDKNHYTAVINFTAEANVRAGTIRGRPKFIPHSMLTYDPMKNTQYLKDDTLYFKVSVELADQKPWLTNTAIKDSPAKLKEKSRTLKEINSVTFALSAYQKKNRSGECFITPSFYTSPNGYHKAIKLYANGKSKGKGTHVSLYVPILKGDYDAKLKWPFTGKYTFTLLNQLEDKNHHTDSVSITVDDNALVGAEWGTSKFIRHSALAYDLVKNTQYLKDDTLYFRVTIEVDDHKPWLECTL